MNEIIQVPGEGAKDAKLVIVGEAPGAEEARQRRPFVGASGNLLNECLSLANIARPTIYITNVIKVRPPDNNIKLYLDIGLKTPKETG